MGARTAKSNPRPRAEQARSDLAAATTDFFVSNAVVIESRPSSVVRIEGAHPLRLAALEAALTGGGIVRAVMWAARPEIDHGPRGPWITPVSEDLTAALARLDSFDDVGVVAERWLDAGPWEPQPNRKDELTVGLLLLAHLSRDALRLHGRLWCWTEMMPAPRARRRSRWGRRLSNRVLRGYVSDRGTTNAASDHPHNRKKPADPGARHGTPSS